MPRLIVALLAIGCAAPESETWEVVETTTSDALMVIEHVRYRSGGLRIEGQVCRPAGSDTYPLLVYNHGGWDGLAGVGEWNGGLCAQGALLGWVVVESSYRGEDGSEGTLEGCEGEVDDVLALLALARREPYVDPTRVAMAGASHGGCITLRAIARGAPVQLAIASAPVVDWAELHTYYAEGLAAGDAPADVLAFWRAANDGLEQSLGGRPADVPQAYERRSPVTYADDIAAFEGRLLVTTGAADPLTPPWHHCTFAAMLSEVAAFHVIDSEGRVAAAAPEGCDALTWREGPHPFPEWRERRYLLAYDEVGHFPAMAPMDRRMLSDTMSFAIVGAMR